MHILTTKSLDWSLFNEGFSIAVDDQEKIYWALERHLVRGEKMMIVLYLDEIPYNATLVNQSFDEEKYPAHGDILQVRYGRNSPLAQRLRELFPAEYQWLKSEREKRGKSCVPLRLPEEMEKLLLLSCGSQKKLCLLTAH
jgi:5-methylcytosine-specific restriction enzyme A